MSRRLEALTVDRLLLGQRCAKALRKLGRLLANRHIVLDEPTCLDHQKLSLLRITAFVAGMSVQHKPRTGIEPAHASDTKISACSRIPCFYQPSSSRLARVGAGIAIRRRFVYGHRHIRNATLDFLAALLRDIARRGKSALSLKIGRGPLVIKCTRYVARALHRLHPCPMGEAIRFVAVVRPNELNCLGIWESRDVVDDNERRLGSVAFSNVFVDPVEVPALGLSQAVHKVKIGFALPAPRTLGRI